ncbi:MAG: DUF2877 domain-containing protein [Oscillospiraceae bacterium]
MTETLAVHKMDEGFAGFLRFGTGIVHSSFKRVINISSRGEIFSIASSDVSPGFNTAVTNAFDFQDFNLPEEASVSCHNGILQLGASIRVDCRFGEIIDCGIHFFPSFSRKNLSSGLFCLESSLRRRSSLIGCLSFVRERFLDPDFVEASSIQQYINSRLSNLCDAYPDWMLFVRCAREIIGLGIGLTPSGDDFLCGFILTLGAAESPGFSPITNSLLSAFTELSTTDVSLQMLRGAFMGKTTWAHIALLNSVFNSGVDIETVLDRMETIGHSSGMDFTAGVVSACHCLLSN